MGFFIREKNDGRRAPGYGCYLLAPLAVLVAVAALRRRADLPGSGRKARPAPASRLEEILRPASALEPIDVKGAPERGGARSYRAAAERPPAARPPERSEPGETGPDPMGAVLGDEAAGSGGGFARLPPALAAEEAPARRGRAPAAPVVYRDPSAETPAAPDDAPRDAAGRVPRGTLLPVCLLTTVDSGNPAGLVQFAACRDLVFDHRRRLPFGTRLLGRYVGAAARDRINLSADTVVFPDGGECAISASAVEADADAGDVRAGIAAEYLSPTAWTRAAPYLAEAAGGALALLQSRLEPSPASAWMGPGGSNDPRAPAYQASARAVDDYARDQLKEFSQRQAGVYLVPAGTALWLQLDADFDPGAARGRVARP